MKKMIKEFSIFELSMILAVIVFTIYFSIINTVNTLGYIIIDGISAIAGIICVVLCAKGKKTQYVFGLFNVIGYIVIAFINKYYGEVMLNALYYLPSQFLGYYLWNKHENKNTNNVKSKKLNLLNSILLILVTGISVIGYKLLLDYLGGTNTILDSASTVISIIANTLMLLRYREQWLLWIIIDGITVVMWFLVKDYVMVTMWLVYLINAFYGYINWTKLQKE